MSNPPRTVTIHVVADDDPGLAACSRIEWTRPSDTYEPNVPRKLCERCRLLVVKPKGRPSTPDYVGDAHELAERLKRRLMLLPRPGCKVDRDACRDIRDLADRLVGIVASCAPTARDGEPVILAAARRHPEGTVTVYDTTGRHVMTTTCRMLVEP